MWNHVYISDGAQHGDVMAGLWKIGTLDLAPRNFFAEEPVYRPMCTIQDRYRRFGLGPSGDGRGVIDIQEAPRCIGLDVGIRSELGDRGLCLDSRVRNLSSGDLRTRGIQTQWPICCGRDVIPRTLNGVELRMAPAHRNGGMK